MAKKHKVYSKEYNSLKAIAREFNVPYSTLYGTMKRTNTDAEEALNIIEKKIDVDNTKLINKNFKSEEISCNSILTQQNIINNNLKFMDNMNSLFTLIDTLGEGISINLIDYENLSKSIYLKPYITENNNGLNIFFYNACIYSNNYYKFIRNIPNINNYQVLTYTVKDQLIDNLIVYYLGILSGKYPNNKYTIVSNDSGYSRFIETLDSQNIKTYSPDYAIQSAEARFNYSLCKYLNSKDIKNNTCYKLDDLKHLLNGFVKNKSNVLDIIKSAEKLELLDMIELEHITYYSFNLNKIKELLKYYRKED